MSLKLFRSTGYSSIFAPGQSRVAMHPGWMVLATSTWAGFVCNVGLWRDLSHSPVEGLGLGEVLALAVFVSAACGLVLSVLGWRRTLKPAATVVLLLSALAACSIWGQALPVDASLLEKGLSGLFFPPWASLLRWQVSAMLAGLALVPTVWTWNTKVRRLSARQQLSATVMGILISVVLLAASGFALVEGVI
jgi:glucan phosphoethanolaminetransferase (alkaline phosphatase superfamily)